MIASMNSTGQTASSGPLLPSPDLLHHRVSDVRDGLVADLRAVDLVQMIGDIAHRHPLREQRDDHVRQATDPSRALRHDHRVERAVAVAGDLHRHRADLGRQRLPGKPVPRIPRPLTRQIPPLITEVIGHLLLQRPLQHLPGQLVEQPTRTGQLQPLGLHPSHQLV
jgi:hypothetical protein